MRDLIERLDRAAVVEGDATRVLAKDLVVPLGPAAEKLAGAIEDAIEAVEDDLITAAMGNLPGGIDNPRSDAVMDLAWKVLWRQVGKRLRIPGTDPVRTALARL